MTYLITFSCYGCHLHGSESGSVDREHNLPGSPVLAVDPRRTAVARIEMRQNPYNLDQPRRVAVLEAIREVCVYRGWTPLAVHVRSTHVHAVVEAEAMPERILIDFKAYASRQLNRIALDGSNRNRWARHGSTRWLWESKDVFAAIQYVIHEQGPPMSVFESQEL